MASAPSNWRKSYSSNTGACVEIAGWHKSSYSGNQGGECIEVAEWYKSSHSKPSGECVETTTSPHHIHIRDTQHRELGHLTFPASSWHAFLSTLKTE